MSNFMDNKAITTMALNKFLSYLNLPKYATSLLDF